MVIAKTASRNVAFKAAKLGESAFAGQSDILIPEVATAGTFTHEEGLKDVGHNADLYLLTSLLTRYVGTYLPNYSAAATYSALLCCCSALSDAPSAAAEQTSFIIAL